MNRSKSRGGVNKHDRKQEGEVSVMILAVRDLPDIGRARRASGRLARKIGFNDKTLAELDLVVTELATNHAVHHTVNGEIILTEINDG